MTPDKKVVMTDVNCPYCYKGFKFQDLEKEREVKRKILAAVEKWFKENKGMYNVFLSDEWEEFKELGES